MIRPLPCTLPILSLCCAAWGENTVDTHQSIARELVDLLSQTEVCLNSCQNAASVEAALPELRRLAARADDIAARQSALPAPTVQDDIAAAEMVSDFATVWQAICKHIDRLQKEGLVSDALRDILKLSPPPAAEQ